MIGKVLGAFVGDKLAKQTTAFGGPTGAAAGVIAASVLRRMSLPAMIALGAGGYVAKKLYDKYGDRLTGEATTDSDSQPPQTSVAPATA